MPQKHFRKLQRYIRRNFSSKELRALSNIQYFSKSKQTMDFSSPDSEISIHTKGQLDINIINPFPIRSDTMLMLFNHSHHINVATGDQSFLEVVMSGKLALYQTMRWKVKLLREFTNRCGEYFGDTSPIYQFYKLQSKEGLFYKSNSSYLNKIQTLYNKNQTLFMQQAQELAEHIKTNHDLNQNLITEKLTNLIASTQNPMRKLNTSTKPRLTTQDLVQLEKLVPKFITEYACTNRNANINDLLTDLLTILPKNFSRKDLVECPSFIREVRQTLRLKQHLLGQRINTRYLQNLLIHMIEFIKETIFKCAMFIIRFRHGSHWANFIEKQIETDPAAEVRISIATQSDELKPKRVVDKGVQTDNVLEKEAHTLPEHALKLDLNSR